MKKNLLFIFIFSFIFISLLTFTSATAQWNTIPDFTSGYAFTYAGNLNSVCYSDLGGSNVCDASSFRVQFRNPDDSSYVSLFPGESSDNSYFKITLGSSSNGNPGYLILQSKGKSLNAIPITVYGSDVPLQSQTSTSFTYTIVGQSQAPFQIKSLIPQIIYGNDSSTILLDDAFNYETRYVVTYNDETAGQSVYLDSRYSPCSIGGIQACLNTNGILSITGLNKDFNSTFTVTAYNDYSSVSTSFTITSFSLNQGTTNTPTHLPISIAPIYMKTGNNPLINGWYYGTSYTEALAGQVKEIDFNDFYSNYKTVGVNFTLPSGLIFADTTANSYSSFGIFNSSHNPTYYLSQGGNVTFYGVANGACFNTTFSPFCTTGNTAPYAVTNASTDEIIALIGFEATHKTDSWGFDSFSPNILYIESFQKPLNITFYPWACNDYGCTTTDTFGNTDKMPLQITSISPTTKASFAPVVIPVNYVKAIHLTDFFNNFDTLYVNWNDGENSYNISTPLTGINTTYVLDSNGNIIYSASLTLGNDFVITSTNTNHDFTVNYKACFGSDCITKDTLTGKSLTQDFIITNESSEFYIKNNESTPIFKNTANLFLGLFPTSESLSGRQKANYVLITMLGISAVLMILGFSTGSVGSLLIITGIIDFFLYLFFVVKGYAPVSILIVGTLIGAFAIYFKSKGGGN